MSSQPMLQGSTWEEVASSVPQSATDTERLMVAVRYRFENDQTDVTDMTVIVNDYFRRARWPRPTNLAATANHCASKGWLSEAGHAEGRKLWRITRKGYEATKLKV
jgi:hypothetical protein